MDQKQLVAPIWLTQEFRKTLPLGRLLEVETIKVGSKEEKIIKWGYYIKDQGAFECWINSNGQVIERR